MPDLDHAFTRDIHRELTRGPSIREAQRAFQAAIQAALVLPSRAERAEEAAAQVLLQSLGAERPNLESVARCAHTTRQRRAFYSYVREAATNGHYIKKPGSRFHDKHGNLPLDLWDSTSDP